MRSHAQSHKSVHMPGELCHTHASSVSGCVLCTLMNSAVAVQHKELPNEDLMELEAQRKNEGRQEEEEVTEELKRFMMQEMAGGFLYLKRCC